ncbi:unnamed protein product, partial [Cyprideis torosa]
GGLPVYEFGFEDLEVTDVVATDDPKELDEIIVSPNPYYESGQSAQGQTGNVMRVSNLPFGSVVTVYTLDEGYEKLKSELEHLKTKGREEVAAAIAEARDKGDLSENAEYDAAKDAQGYLELKINEMEKVMANARIIDKSQLDTSSVTILSTVRIKNTKSNKEVSYTLVAETEANLKEKKISVTSPIGKGLLGKKVGEIAQVTTPAGTIDFEIMSIEIL